MADQSLTLPASSADELIAAHDGDLALLYLFLLRRGRYDAEEAARELCRTLRDIDAAEEKLRRLGLFPEEGVSVPRGADKPLPPADELPQLTAEDLARRYREDLQLSHIYDEAERVFGRKLSSAEMRSLCGVYDHLELPAEVLYELLHFCAEDAASRRVRLSMRTVEKEAYRWNDLEILTLEQAEEHIRSAQTRKEALRRVLPVLGIRDREPAAREREYISGWLDMGFEEEALAIAYDRTVTNTGKLSWPYMNKIVLSWHGKGLHTPSEIEAGDGRAPRGRGNPGASARKGATEEDYVFPDKL